MLTAEEYIRLKPTKCLFIHNLDLMEHLLKGDLKNTAYGNIKDPSTRCYEIFLREIDKSVPSGNFRKIEEGFNKRKTTVEVASEVGNLNVDRYIARESLCFDEPVKRFKPRLARTLIFDYGKNQGEHTGSDCKKRYEKIYEQVLRCEENGEPCRVIAADGHKFEELEPGGVLHTYIVVKDYTDPIFPAIWGMLKTNAAAWALGNVIADYLIGTRSPGNGRSVEFNIGDDIPIDEDVQIVDAVKIRR